MQSPEHINQFPEQSQEDAMKETPEDEELELTVTIGRDATFADLFSAIDAIEQQKGTGVLHFEEELWDHFDTEMVQEILSFRESNAAKAATTKVIEFFEEHDCAPEDITTSLPIEFASASERFDDEEMIAKAKEIAAVIEEKFRDIFTQDELETVTEEFVNVQNESDFWNAIGYLETVVEQHDLDHSEIDQILSEKGLLE